MKPYIRYSIEHFNSHAHVERDDIEQYMAYKAENFNSHAHVERDYRFTNVRREHDISTHTLTWSVTDFKRLDYFRLFISTHTLTWSVTRYYHIISADVEFQLTRSRGA